MIQIFFLLYLYLLGLLFGLCFRNWIPVRFIIFSSFLWGSVIYSFTLYVLYMIGITINAPMFISILLILMAVVLLFCVKTWNQNLEKNVWFTILFVLVNFTLLNIIFIKFNYSLATYDSFTFLNLARSIGFDGFSNSVIQTLLSWGGLIPILQSSSIHLGFDYLVTVQFSFSLSLIILFFYICERLSNDLIQNQKYSRIIALITTFVLVSTPMIIIQLFYIHSNLTTALFFFLASFCGWMAIEEKNNMWFVFFNLSLIGVNLSRTETFIYSLVLIFLLLFSNKLNYKQRLFAFLPILVVQTIWFIYVYLRSIDSVDILNLQIVDLLNGTKNLNPQKLELMIIFMIAIISIVLFSRLKILSTKIFPISNKYFLLPFIFTIILLVVLKPTHMGTSIKFYFTNLFYAGEWGFSYWLLTIMLLVLLFNNRLPIEDYIIKILISNVIIIVGLSFLRNPFRYGWSDSANRLMTFGIPIGLMLIAISISRWLKIKIDDQEIKSQLSS